MIIKKNGKTTYVYQQHPLFHVWVNMRVRCKNHKDYAGRGISVCDEWQDSFESFKTWANDSGWAKGLSLDRTNNDGNYEPSNCRWVTWTVQARNRRANTVVTYNGETKNLSEWAEVKGIKYSTLVNRLSWLGWDFHRAITEDPMAFKLKKNHFSLKQSK